MITLFSTLKTDLDSVVFELNHQKTVVAMGLQPDDYITFEIVRISDASRAKVCGCRLTESGLSSVVQLLPLTCPSCDNGTPSLVRVTPENPIVVLDAPQGALMRAIFHGTGLDLHSVTVTLADSDSINLSSTMRGCPPMYCEEGEETWTPTGLHRCTSTYVEIEELSNCGNKRWVECGPTVWVDTGARRCFNGNYQMEERNQCNATRWTTIEAEQWVETGLQRCNESTYDRQEVNQCGRLRWTYAGVVAWVATGNYDCRSNVNWREERNQCGDLRFVNTGESCGTSTHTMLSLTPAAASVTEGEEACWNFVLNGPVIGSPLTIEFLLTGADQTRHAYTTPVSVTLGVGASEGQLCIATTDDVVVDGTEQLCVTPQLSTRLINAPGVSCINVLDNDLADEDPYSIVSITQTTADPVTEGQPVCWEFEVSRPVENTPLIINATWSGADFVRHGYANGSVTIPVGETTGTMCVYTVDDLDVDGTEQLCMASIVANARLTGSPSLPACVDVLDNDSLPPGDSTHTILSIVPVDNPEIEGQAACWLVTLDSPVANSNLLINFNLSGADQVRHGYPPPSLTINVGDDSGTVCVTTTDDIVVDGMEQLCIAAILSARVTAAPAASCININDNDVAASVHTITCVTPPADAVEGALLCWEFELNAPVSGSPLTVSGVLSGSEQVARGYTNPSVVVAVGQSSGQLCVQTLDDSTVEGTKVLCLTISTSARVTSVTDAPCV